MQRAPLAAPSLVAPRVASGAALPRAPPAAAAGLSLERGAAAQGGLGRSLWPLAALSLVLRRPRWTPRRGVERRAVAAALATDVGTEADICIEPSAARGHACTLIYLHGFAQTAKEYLSDESKEFCYPWFRGSGSEYAPGLRVVLPTAERMEQPWGVCEPSWYLYERPDRNKVGSDETLRYTRSRLSKILREEVERLGGDGSKIFLGGLSQGCTVALDVYVREATRLRLGGFCGSVGFVPRDGGGFSGTRRAVEGLLRDAQQAARPVWLQCATDDHRDVPWRRLVQPSLRSVEGRWPGLQIREVSGRGHIIGDWEAHMLNDFMKQHAREALG